MNPVSENLKTWAQFIEKSLIIITLLIGICASSYKGVEFLTAKAGIAKAQKNKIDALIDQENEKTKAIRLLTQTYTDLLKQLNIDLQDIDTEMRKEVFKNTVGWEKMASIREAKVNDRNQLLLTLGSQVVELKEYEQK